MSSLLQITYTKPNPLGKDRTASGAARPEQLLGEWVDIKNVGTEAIRLSTISLEHTLYTDRCQSTGRTKNYWNGGGSETLKPGASIRVYTGVREKQHLMSPIDKSPIDWIGFANMNNFVLNNKCGDTIVVNWQDTQGRQYQDIASYAPNPPEGAVLQRSGANLVPLLVSSYR